MAEVTLTVAGRDYTVGCRDGEETELATAAELLDRRAGVVAGLGGLNEARTLLMAGLLLADELMSARHGTGPSTASAEQGLDAELELRIARLTDRAERLVERLERAAS